MSGFFKDLKQCYFPKAHNLLDWCFMTSDGTHIYRDVQPPGGESYVDQIAWADIKHVCCKVTEQSLSDDRNLFTSHRAESHLIPLKGVGGTEPRQSVLERGLFDYAFAITAASSRSGQFCWLLQRPGANLASS